MHICWVWRIHAVRNTDRKPTRNRRFVRGSVVPHRCRTEVKGFQCRHQFDAPASCGRCCFFVLGLLIFLLLVLMNACVCIYQLLACSQLSGNARQKASGVTGCCYWCWYLLDQVSASECLQTVVKVCWGLGWLGLIWVWVKTGYCAKVRVMSPWLQ